MFKKHEWNYIEKNTDTWVSHSIRFGKGKDCTTYFVEPNRVIRREPSSLSFGPWIEEPVIDEGGEDDFGNLELYEWMNPHYEA
jgi:hypothetical protein